jgi:AN1-like Zinc finger
MRVRERGATMPLICDRIIIGKPALHEVERAKDIKKGKSGVTKMSLRCGFCNRRTPIAASMKCRCGLTLCQRHRDAEKHGCTYDYRSEERAKAFEPLVYKVQRI